MSSIKPVIIILHTPAYDELKVKREKVIPLAKPPYNECTILLNLIVVNSIDQSIEKRDLRLR